MQRLAAASATRRLDAVCSFRPDRIPFSQWHPASARSATALADGGVARLLQLGFKVRPRLRLRLRRLRLRRRRRRRRHCGRLFWSSRVVQREPLPYADQSSAASARAHSLGQRNQRGADAAWARAMATGAKPSNRCWVHPATQREQGRSGGGRRAAGAPASMTRVLVSSTTVMPSRTAVSATRLGLGRVAHSITQGRIVSNSGSQVTLSPQHPGAYNFKQNSAPKSAQSMKEVRNRH